MKWAGDGSREKGTTWKTKRLPIWIRFLGKLKASQNIVMLGICLGDKSFSCKNKKNEKQRAFFGTLLSASFTRETSLHHCNIRTCITHILQLRELRPGSRMAGAQSYSSRGDERLFGPGSPGLMEAAFITTLPGHLPL